MYIQTLRLISVSEKSEILMLTSSNDSPTVVIPAGDNLSESEQMSNTGVIHRVGTWQIN